MAAFSASETIKKLAVLQQAFKLQLAGKIDEIENLWASIDQHNASYSSLTDLHRMAHGLAGSGGTFGAMAVSTVARELEQRFKFLLTGPAQAQPLSAVMHQQIGDDLSQLRQAADAWQPSDVPYIQPQETKQSQGGNLIYLADDDELFAADLCTRLEHADYRVRHFARLADFEAACEQQCPAAVIMDMVFAESDVAGADVVARLKAKVEICPPVIFISVRDDISTRLAVARTGGHRFFCKPLNMDQFIPTLDGLTARLRIKPFRVLLVDDDEALLEYYVTVLTEVGMEVKTLSNPLHALTLLADFKPDITVLDVYMPACTGPELAQVIRQDDAWAMMPIMFLSTEVDLNRQLAAMNLGGDDFLVKPVDADHLVAAITTRAKRARWTNRLNVDLQSALRESEYQSITMGQHNIVSIANVAGEITHANDKFCDVSGYSREELLGQNHRILKTNEHPRAFYDDLWRTISQGKVWHGTICNRAKNGDKYWVESTIVPFLDNRGKPYKYVSARTDITQLKQTEERFSFAVEGAGDGVWDWDMRSNTMRFSRLYMEMLGYTENELPHHADTWVNSVHDDDMERVQQNLQDYLNGRHSIYAVELRLRCKYGDYKWILRRGTVVSRDDAGKPVRMIGIHSDISQRKEAEQNLINAREDAENANRAKSQFLSSMSHELRTPMNAIMGFSQLLKMSTDQPLSESQLENVEEITKASNHLLELINEVLDLAKIEAGHIDLSIEAVVLGEVIAESLQLITPLAQKRGIQISLAQDGTKIDVKRMLQQNNAVRADHTRLRQVLLNLLSNAVKYNAEKGEIVIDCRCVGDQQVRISISDTGAGITPQQQAQLFKAFNRLDAAQTEIEGTGIGLVITKNIVELMGGNIGMDSQPGKGSTFWIELPSDTLQVGQKIVLDKKGVTPAPLPLSSAGHEHTVLYIEDNPANLRLVAQLLSRLSNIHMWSAHEPMLGLELAAEYKPDLILLDINLPGIDGFEVLKHLRQREATRNTPVIAISANAMPKDIERGMKAGFDNYITKPVDVDALLQAVENVLQGEVP
jgi:hypothetical protein